MSAATGAGTVAQSQGVEVSAEYLCHECGGGLEAIETSSLLWCGRCSVRRRVPTHPALIRTDLLEAAA